MCHSLKEYAVKTLLESDLTWEKADLPWAARVIPALQRLTFEDFSEGTATELLDDSVAFVQNFLAFLKHDLN